MNTKPLFLITALIRPEKLDNVVTALHEVGVNGITTTEKRFFSRNTSHTEIYRAAEYVVKHVLRLQVEMLVDEKTKERALEALITATNDDNVINDGKIWIIPVEQVIRIRTGETGAEAL